MLREVCLSSLIKGRDGEHRKVLMNKSGPVVQGRWLYWDSHLRWDVYVCYVCYAAYVYVCMCICFYYLFIYFYLTWYLFGHVFIPGFSRLQHHSRMCTLVCLETPNCLSDCVCANGRCVCRVMDRWPCRPVTAGIDSSAPSNPHVFQLWEQSDWLGLTSEVESRPAVLMGPSCLVLLESGGFLWHQKVPRFWVTTFNNLVSLAL